VGRLLPFDVVCVMRERTPLPTVSHRAVATTKSLIASTGRRNASIDVEAATERGIAVGAYGIRCTLDHRADVGSHPRQRASGLYRKNANLRAAGWQLTIGESLYGKTLGVLGLGNIGTEVARIGLAFGMEVYRVEA